MRRLLLFLSLAFPCLAQISSVSVSPESNRAILRYTAPDTNACTLQVADMNRGITIASASTTGGVVTVLTVAPHGLLAGDTVRIEGTGGTLDGWQPLTSASGSSFTFAGSGSASAGNVGVLINDVNPNLFTGANSDSRSALNVGTSRVVVLGLRGYAPIANDGNRYSRILQTNSRHHVSITCGSYTADTEFTTRNIPYGDSHNSGVPGDPSNPGQPGFPNVQWSNTAQTLLDPLTGLRSYRSSPVVVTTSAVQTYQTPFDLDGVWTSPSSIVTGTGTATYSGTCAGTHNCALFARADSLSLGGGATYTAVGPSALDLDWVQVSIANASINNAGCSGTGCQISTCLTVNGQTCATSTKTVALTTTPQTVTLGTTTLMDVWQASGPPQIARPDVSKATGTVNYNAATSTLTLVSGNKFSIKWGPGSRITVNGTEYAIASVLSELSLTLTSGPGSNLSGVAYSANNFGALVWKTVANADQISLGQATFTYGYSADTYWPSLSVDTCGPKVTAYGGSSLCFVNQELFLASPTGTLADLGLVQTNSNNPTHMFRTAACGSSVLQQFDPADGTTWYCVIDVGFGSFPAEYMSLIKVSYTGTPTALTPGTAIPDCAVSGSNPPCLTFTIMQPSGTTNSMTSAAIAFSPAYASAIYPTTPDSDWNFNGVSTDGYVAVGGRYLTQDKPGWLAIYNLGDRTPSGTDSNSLKIVALTSTYSNPTWSYCTLHSGGAPDGSGWINMSMNDISTGISGSGWPYTTTLASGALTTSTSACPSSPWGAWAPGCSTITLAGQPTHTVDANPTLHNIAIGDVMQMDSEFMRVVTADPINNVYVVQRAFGSTVAAHSNGVTVTMTCASYTCNTNGTNGYCPGGATRNSLWNYANDPYGTNTSWNTLVPTAVENGHGNYGNGTYIFAPAVNSANCPSDIFGGNPSCYQVYHGTSLTSWLGTPTSSGAGNRPFAWKTGTSTPNPIDSHPGPCYADNCLDARPMLGGAGFSSFTQPNAGTYPNVWVSSTGTTLTRKFLDTMAYVGRFPLVDVSGPGSSITAAAAYTYCVPYAAGECYSGSTVGQVYVNAPYVSTNSCPYAGFGGQLDDTNMICIMDLGYAAQNVMQVYTAASDTLGAQSRRLGSLFARWNQPYGFWNTQATPTGSSIFTYGRWMDGVRTDNLITVLPPLPALDSVDRSTFQDVPVSLAPPAALGANNAVVQFGYDEYGTPGNLYCTSRKEACVAVATTAVWDATNPFYFATTDTYSGVPCSTSCTIHIPALPQHILYYRVIYRNVSNSVIFAGPIKATTVN